MRPFLFRLDPFSILTCFSSDEDNIRSEKGASRYDDAVTKPFNCPTDQPRNKDAAMSKKEGVNLNFINLSDFETAASKLLPPKSFACKYPSCLIHSKSLNDHSQSSKPAPTMKAQHNGTN